ncbi:efflux RND transporter periplasmic adaptor subunit [Elusimicrobiota bacterium]
MKKTTLILVLVVAVAALGAACKKSGEGHGGPGVAKAEKKPLYHCPMHPTFTSDRQEPCPICGMDLVVIEDAEDGGEHEGKVVKGQGRVRINPRRRQNIGVKTETASLRRLVKVIRTVGRVAYDPKLYRTQEEYLTALNSYRQIKAGSSEEAGQRAKALLESSRLRLKIMGISNAQIAELEKSAKPEEGLLLSQGKGQKLWLYADVYESELGHVQVGQTIEAVSASMPGRKFSGKLKAIDPTINPKTRSVRVRVLLSDPKGVLRPDTYLNAHIRVDLGERLAIPVDAVVDSGVRQIIFVDEGDGYLSPREALLGVRVDDYVEILEGAEDGEDVVTSGNFLIDSESKLKAAISAFGSGGHRH